MQFANKRGFTMVELIIVIAVISVGLMGLIVGMNKGLVSVGQTRQKVISINLAREGMEAMYNIRDTNRTIRAGKKDNCWLKKDPFDTTPGTSSCIDDPRMQSGAYMLLTAKKSGQSYFLLSGIFTPIDLSDGVDASDLQYSLCESGGAFFACPGIQAQNSEGIFFRQINGLGLFDKGTSGVGGTYLSSCTKGDDSTCGDDTAKEFRFCSKVSYIGNSIGETQLCGIFTNFSK